MAALSAEAAAQAAYEKTFAAEKVAAGLRLAVIGLNTVTYFFFVDRQGYVEWLALSVLAVAWAYGLYVYAGQPFRRYPVMATSYFTSTSDATLITIWLASTGGFNSPYYVLWYASIVAVAFRYDYRATIAAATVYGGAYTGLAAASGALPGHLGDVLIRVGYIFLVGALGGAQSRDAFTMHRSKIEAEGRAKALEEAEVRFRAVAETAKDSIITTDESGTIVYFNGEAERVFGVAAGQVIGHPVTVLFGEDPAYQRAVLTRRVWNSDALDRPFELSGKHGDGHSIPLEISLAKWRTKEGTFFTAIARDVTERKRAEDALAHQAFYDSLTDLANRRLFQDRAQQALRRARRQEGAIAVLLMDLDFFKDVNDTFGHSFGDMLLKEVASRLRDSVRDTDTIARFGGDEFAVLLEGIGDVQDAVRTAEKILRSLSQSFEVNGEALSVAGSIGVAVSPAHGHDPETLLRRADVAMYVAKSSREGIAVYDQQQDEHSARRISLLNDLRSAIDGSDLTLYYQPKVGLEPDGELRVEALARWLHPTEGEIPPDYFIPLAERSGVINRLTERVLGMAIRQCRDWSLAGLRANVAVNLSVRNLHDPALPATVERLLHDIHLPASSLSIEVTESTIMSKPGRVMEVLTALHELGIRISIDDFGTGYSSLAYLKRVPAHELKIDKSFVLDMIKDENDAIIVRSTIDMAHNLGLRVVAEGVETAEVWDRLRGLGCDEAQGYYIARPMPASAFSLWAQAWAAQHAPELGASRAG